MNRSDDFIKTLNRLHYPQICDLQASDFNSFFSHDELSSLLDSFCNLTEDNVLTPDEISEYSALTSNDIYEIENLAKNDQPHESITEMEKAEMQYLKEKLNHIKEHSKILEKQKEQFIKYEEELLEERDKCVKMLVENEEKFKTYAWQKVPKSESDYVSTLKVICKLTQDLGRIFADFDSMLPMTTLFKKFVEHHLEKEKMFLGQIKQFLLGNFKYQEEVNMISLKPCKDLQDARVKELTFFQNVVKNATMHNIHIVNEIKKSSAFLTILEQFDDKGHFPDCFNFPSQLKGKLSEVIDSNKKYEEKEERRLQYLSYAVTKNAEMQCSEVSATCTQHELKVFECFSNIMLFVVSTLISQKGRLEFLAVCLNVLIIEMHNIVNLVEKLYKQFTNEQALFLDRQASYEQKLNEDVSAERMCLSADSLFLSIYKIAAKVNDFEAQDATHVSLDVVLNRIGKYHEVKSVFQEKQESQLKTADSVGQYFLEVENLFSLKNETNAKWLEMERNLNVDLNNLVIKLTVLEKRMKEYQNHFNEEQKLIQRKNNRNMARHLYVFALRNQEHFQKCVEEIEEAVKNSEDYIPSAI